MVLEDSGLCAVNEWHYRFKACVMVKGGHFEHQM